MRILLLPDDIRLSSAECQTKNSLMVLGSRLRSLSFDAARRVQDYSYQRSDIGRT